MNSRMERVKNILNIDDFVAVLIIIIPLTDELIQEDQLHHLRIPLT